MRYRDRADAGRQLAARVAAEVGDIDAVVLALPRGGVAVAVAVADALDAPLDVLVARKVGAPHQPEYGIGAVAEGGGRVADRTALEHLRISGETFDALARREEARLVDAVDRFRGGQPLPPLAGRAAVVVDDGLATGVTAEAALASVRALRPERVLLAVPVGSADTVERLQPAVDVLICPSTPPQFRAVGEWYDDFSQTTDDEVRRLLAGTRRLVVGEQDGSPGGG